MTFLLIYAASSGITSSLLRMEIVHCNEKPADLNFGAPRQTHYIRRTELKEIPVEGCGLFVEISEKMGQKHKKMLEERKCQETRKPLKMREINLKTRSVLVMPCTKNNGKGINANLRNKSDLEINRE